MPSDPTSPKEGSRKGGHADSGDAGTSKHLFEEGLRLIECFRNDEGKALIEEAAELGYFDAKEFLKDPKNNRFVRKTEASEKNDAHIKKKTSSPGLNAFFRIIFYGPIILMILFAIAYVLPGFVSYKQRGYDAEANAEIKNAFTISQPYFQDFPEGKITIDALREYGFKPNEDVKLTIVGNGKDDLLIKSVHKKMHTTWTVDAIGKIRFETQ